MILSDKPDRIINHLYAVLAVDKKTRKEGLCAICLGGPQMQAVVSSLESAIALREVMIREAARENITYAFEIVKFERKEIQDAFIKGGL